jgi:GTP-binding protein HflX
MRKIELGDNGPEVILSDTVGFISDLPTELVAAFRATLEEVLAADLVCHIRDISHPETDNQASDVQTILEGLGVSKETPQIEVWNKIDQVDSEEGAALANQASRAEHTHIVSALSGEGIENLIEVISEGLAGHTRTEDVLLGYNEGRKRAWLFEKGLVQSEDQGEDGFLITVRWNAHQAALFDSL